MSRTYRTAVQTIRSFWLTSRTPRGDSKPLATRFKAPDGKFGWRCRCEDYCIAGKLHKHHKRMIAWDLHYWEDDVP